MPRPSRAPAPLLALSLALAGAGCERDANVYVPPPPAEVTVARPVLRTVPITLEATGTTRGAEEVEIRARVAGFIAEKHVRGGERVAEGDLLYLIDPRTYEAAVRQAQAEVAARQAEQRLAAITLARVEKVFREDAASEQERDRALAAAESAEAAVALAQARLDAAQLDLEFTRVTAPVAGRLSLETIDVGQLVGADQPTLLGTVVRDDVVYATYAVDERQVLALNRTHRARRPGENGRPDITVLLGMADEEGYPHVGTFRAADNQLDPLTGTILAEATFDNPDGVILPGLFVRLRVLLGEREALLVPDVAVLTEQTGNAVYVVGPDDVVERRSIAAGPTHDGMREIERGLAPDDRVIVNGLLRARPGEPVHPTEIDVAAARADDAGPATAGS